MKTNATQELEAALDRCEAIEAKLTEERKLLDDSAAELNGLQKTIDLSDGAQVQKLTHLLAIAQVGNTRRGYRHQENEAAQNALVETCQDFASNAFAPRLREMEGRAAVKVEGKLKQHFPNVEALRLAARHSPEISSLAEIRAQTVIHDYTADGAVRLAEGLLKAWSDADAFEQEHLS